MIGRAAARRDPSRTRADRSRSQRFIEPSGDMRHRPMSPLGSMNLNCRYRSARVLAPSAATGQPRLGAADVGLVHLYRWPAQQGLAQTRDVPTPIGAGRCSMAQRSLVGADLQYSLSSSTPSIRVCLTGQAVAAGNSIKQAADSTHMSHYVKECPRSDSKIVPAAHRSCGMVVLSP